MATFIKYEDGTTAEVRSARPWTYVRAEQHFDAKMSDLVGSVEVEMWLAYTELKDKGEVLPVFSEWVKSIAAFKNEQDKEDPFADS